MTFRTVNFPQMKHGHNSIRESIGESLNSCSVFGDKALHALQDAIVDGPVHRCSLFRLLQGLYPQLDRLLDHKRQTHSCISGSARRLRFFTMSANRIEPVGVWTTISAR